MKIIPILTEKTLAEAKKDHYTFWVDFGLNKNQIRRVIDKVFGVHITNIRTINFKGGSKKNFRGITQTVKNKKKAIVDLKGDEKIDLFEEKKK